MNTTGVPPDALARSICAWSSGVIVVVGSVDADTQVLPTARRAGLVSEREHRGPGYER
jgi:hypothetical protein